MRPSRRHWLVVGLALLAACAPNAAESPTSVLLITLDTTRADRLGCYGYFRATSPNLDRLAAGGILFENAYAPMATTLPSHVSVMTATNPGYHGVKANFNDIRRGLDADGGLPTFAQLLSRSGYATAAVVAAAPLRAETGISTGFQSYDEPTDTHRGADAVVDGALEWIDRRPQRPFLLWLHFWDPHGPYEPKPGFEELFTDDRSPLRRHLQARGFEVASSRGLLETNTEYDREVRYMDAQLGRLFAGLEQRGLLEPLGIAIVGDHGEGLGQHGWLHHSRIFNEQLRVPFILKLPGPLDGPGRRVARVASLIDVVPTLVAALDLPIDPDDLAGVEGIDLLADESPRDAVFVERVHRQRSAWLRKRAEVKSVWEPGRKYALVGADWKYVHLTERPDQLYDLRSDPHELRDVIDAHPERAAALLERTRAFLSRYEAGAPAFEVERDIDPERRRELRALGYVE